MGCVATPRGLCGPDDNFGCLYGYPVDAPARAARVELRAVTAPAGVPRGAGSLQ